jgi:hypothetical protein
MTAHQTNITYASAFVECLCQGEKDDTTLGTEGMKDSANTCSNCPTTSDLIVKDLQVCHLHQSYTVQDMSCHVDDVDVHGIMCDYFGEWDGKRGNGLGSIWL